MQQSAGQARPATSSIPLSEALTLAERYRLEGRLMEAEALCQRVLQARPNMPEAEHLMGVIAHQSGKLGEAIKHVCRAVELAPNVAVFHANLGELFRLVGRPHCAVDSAQRALAISPNMPTALSNLGVALYDLKEFEEAVLAQRRAITAKPDFAEAHSNLGNALQALRRFEEAIESYRHAIELNPGYADAWANMGTMLHHGGYFAEAESVLRRAIAILPGHANAHAGLGILLLMWGKFGEGWDEYEWRLSTSDASGQRLPNFAWRGESLAGKHVYVRAEQGFGDTLQFSRYIPLLAGRGARVTFRVQQQLVALMRESLPGVAILGDDGDPGPYQYHVALLSLPLLFKTQLESIPGDTPYLRPSAGAAQRWRDHLAKTMTGVKVGIAWRGSPEHANDSRRSITLSTLRPLFSLGGASFVSLQVSPRAGDLKMLRGRRRPLEVLPPGMVDFVDTAGAVAALDMVITVDTSVAHLAGALGKPVWLLLPWVTDWRWMLSREDTPWYPTMRLYRQKNGEDWMVVIGRVKADLKAVVEGDDTLLAPFEAEGKRCAAQAAAIIAAEAAQAAMSSSQSVSVAEQFIANRHDLVRQTTAVEPNNAGAWHMLGIAAHQSGRLGDAIEHLERAIAIDPNVALYHANLCEMRRLAGRIDEAIVAGRRALELNCDFPAALSNLGIALFDHGEFEEALACHDRAVALQDDFVQGHSNRGNALQRLGRFAEAECAYRRAIELQPGFADAWNNLGTCLRELKCPEEAEAVYRRCLECGPTNPNTLDNLALALKDLERFDEAAELLRQALVIEPESSHILLHYGAVLLAQHKVEAAAAATEHALVLDPNNHDCVNQMGRVALERGDLEGSLRHHRHALALKPDLADAYNNIGNALKELGLFEEAETAYLDSIRLDPTIAGVYVNLADLRRFSHGDPQLVAMETHAAKRENLSKTDQMQLDFALGKAFADLEDYDRSFTHLIKANAAKRAAISYDEASTMAQFDRIEAIFTPELIAAKTGNGEVSSMPVFVIGMPRSGTTLVEQIVASHPMVHGAGELLTMNEVILAFRGVHCETAPYPELFQAIDPTGLRRIGVDYVSRLHELAPLSERVTDKMPSNFYFVGLIHLALPNAKIIHCRRDPVDTCVSCFSKLFSSEQNHTYDLSELGRYYRRYERLMAHWRQVLPAERILDVQYEDVVADLEGQARRIIAHCGLAWDAHCLAFHETERPIRTASATQVRRPIYRSAVGRWRVYEKHLGPLLEALLR